MATSTKHGPTAAERRQEDQEADKHVETLRKRDAEGGVVEVPKPVHGDPSAQTRPLPGSSVIGVRTGSEAAVDSGMGPVLPPSGPGVSAFTRVKNKDLRERDEAEFKRRGFKADGSAVAGTPVSVSFEGVMMVERRDGEKPQLVNGSYSGQIPEEGLLIRPLTDKERKEFFPKAPAPVPTVAKAPAPATSTGGATSRS